MLQKYYILIALLLAGMVSTACSGAAQETGRTRTIPWWVWLLVIVVALVVFIWLWLTSPKKRKEEAPTAQIGVAAPSHVVETPEGLARRAAPVAEGREADDLQVIEGIGPKISGLLQAAGITTFAQLAATDVSRLREILAQAGLSALADPTTWPEQASLAAAGKWDELQALQDALKGGRRV